MVGPSRMAWVPWGQQAQCTATSLPVHTTRVPSLAGSRPPPLLPLKAWDEHLGCAGVNVLSIPMPGGWSQPAHGNASHLGAFSPLPIIISLEIFLCLNIAKRFGALGILGDFIPAFK